MGEILKAERVLEYVAFVVVKLNTEEGFAYMFVAIDAYSDYVINIGVERDDSPETFLKNVYLLSENKEFQAHNTNGFTLVFEEKEELSDRIDAIIKGEGGKVLFNKTFNNYISNPFLLSFSKYLKRNR